MADGGDASPRKDARLAEIRVLAEVGAKERGDARARRMIFAGETRTIWCDPSRPFRLANVYNARCAEREAAILRPRPSSPAGSTPSARITDLLTRLQAELTAERIERLERNAP